MMTQDCLFCKIIQKTIPAKVTYEDDLAIAFYDINPQAPVHQVIIPKQHFAHLNDVDPEHNTLMGHLLQVARKLAKESDIDKTGYRIVNNCNADGGQTVFHLHLHLLGGRHMAWPPG
jgi:histidine triad (HIT) family protein